MIRSRAPAIRTATCALIALLASTVYATPPTSTTAPATPPIPLPPIAGAPDATAGRAAWIEVHRVLLSPRCMNCHPTGDRPLQHDDNRPHAMNISRRSEANGLTCATCHQTHNSETLGIPNGPPGAPNWHLPPADMPMIFQGKTPAALCAQMKDPAQNGNKTLEELHHHVAQDPLVLWGWTPGGTRTPPPLPHADFVAAFRTWIDAGAPCPE